MESVQDSFSFSSLKEILEAIEVLVSLEAQRTGHPWVHKAQLNQLFWQRYGATLEAIIQDQGYGGSLRSLLTNSGKFSIYGMAMAQEFYLAPRSSLMATGDPAKSLTLAKGQRSQAVERPRLKQDRSLPSPQPQCLEPLTATPQSRIQTAHDLAQALSTLITDFMDQEHQTVTVSQIKQSFYARYQQPLREVVRQFYPDFTPLEILQTMPNLYLCPMEGDSQITFLFSISTDQTG